MNDPRPDAGLVHDLADRWHGAVAGTVGPARVALLDFPGHRNVGDSLIWLGERRLLARAGTRVAYTCEHHSLREGALRRRSGTAPVLLHGGGNFGDVWPQYPRFREGVTAAYSSMARQNLAAGVRTFSRGRVVVTDRLHGHVLCLLLGIPHVVLDNSYGKIRDFREAWTSGSELTRTATTADEAVDLARELLGSPLVTAP
ncbi:polysaccharide pyruvyl transferase family protein [Kineococcus sp. SYSU DK005]|uniref:polysaccharide pyruvyl transferase family protein n=1 Tax=Kineococcus sp. SYSU DK005 TaxID=3383126 RepID=UPI003D7C9F98